MDVFKGGSAQDRKDWRNIEGWVYFRARDDRDLGPSPTFLDLTIDQWVELADRMPQVVQACGMLNSVELWRARAKAVEKVPA